MALGHPSNVIPLIRPSCELEKASAPLQKQKEEAVPGFPNVSKITYPRSGREVFRHRAHDPVSGEKISITLGDAALISKFDLACRVNEINESLANGVTPKHARQSLNEFVEKIFFPWAKTHKRSYSDDVSRYNSYLRDTIGNIPMAKITRTDIESVLAKLTERLSPATVNRALMLLRSIFRLAVETKLIQHNPCIGIKQLRENPPSPVSLETDELARLMEVLKYEPQPQALFVKLLLVTGARAGEILNLKWGDIDYRLSLIHLLLTKAGVPQTLPLTPAVQQLLTQLRQQPNVHPTLLFPSTKGGKPMSLPYKWLRAVLAKAGLPRSGFHVFRKTMATQAVVNAGLDVFTVSKLLRHASVSTTEKHYLAMHQRRLAAAAHRVSEVLIAGSASGKEGK